MYQFLTVFVTMRDCETKEEAIERLSEILPQHPDENTTYCESWVIEGSKEWEE